jgi:hypothetical protein
MEDQLQIRCTKIIPTEELMINQLFQYFPENRSLVVKAEKPYFSMVDSLF